MAFVIAPSLEHFELFANKLADDFAKDGSDDERNKVKEYFRRKVINSKLESDGNIQIGGAYE